MKTNHRIRRNTAQPEPSSIGAPFLGVFPVWITQDINPDEVEVYAYLSVPPFSPFESANMWTPGKQMDLDAFPVVAGGVITYPTSAVVGENGDVILLQYPDSVDGSAQFVIAGHPTLVSTSGQACGGYGKQFEF